MVRNNAHPNLKGEFVRWLNESMFTVVIPTRDGPVEMLAHKDYWTGDIPEYEPDVKSDG